MTALAEKWGILFKDDKRFHGKVAHCHHRGVILLMPMTYMNLSGESVQKVANFYKIAPTEVLVIADDVALNFGKLRLREGGSSGGHKGFASVQTHLTQNFPRLRVGIGSPSSGAQGGYIPLEDYVLGRFTANELQEMPKIVEQCVHAINLVIDLGVAAAMNKVNESRVVGAQAGSKDEIQVSANKIKNIPVVGKEKLDGQNSREPL